MASAGEALLPEIRSATKKGCSQDIFDLIATLPTASDQLSVIRQCIKGIAFDDWSDDLDLMVSLAWKAVELGENSGDDLLAEANVICFNSSANLADCWGDSFHREPRHFEAGLALAEKAVELRRRLNKPPSALAMAYWAKAKHLMSLGRMAEARRSMAQSADWACEDLQSDGCIIANGYLAIIDGSQPAAEKVVAVLRQMSAENDKAEDCQVIVEQLRVTCENIGSDLAQVFKLD